MVRLTRTRADTFGYYARTRTARAFASVTLLALLTGLGVWQYPNAASAVEGWAATLSGRDEILAATSELSDVLDEAVDAHASAPEGAGLDVTALVALIDECGAVRTSGEATAMFECSLRLSAAADSFSRQVERYTTASQIVALEQQATDAARQREEAAAAAAKKAAEEKAAREAADRAARVQAEEAARRAAEEERRRQQQKPPPSSGGDRPAPNKPSKPSTGSGSSLSTTVTCSSRQTVTVTASGGGTVTVTISGAGTASRSGGGQATASATGQGTFTIHAKSTSGGLTLNPSWTGACW